MEYKLFLDTNALLNLQSAAFKEKFVISQKTLEEIESIKTSGHKDGDVKYKARSIARLLDQSENYEVIAYTPEVRKIINDFTLDETPDNIILASAYWYNQSSSIIVCTDDLNCKFISKNIFKLPTKGTQELNLVRDLVSYTYKSGETHTGYVTALYPEQLALNFQSKTKHCKKVNARKCRLLWKFNKIYWL